MYVNLNRPPFLIGLLQRTVEYKTCIKWMMLRSLFAATWKMEANVFSIDLIHLHYVHSALNGALLLLLCLVDNSDHWMELVHNAN